MRYADVDAFKTKQRYRTSFDDKSLKSCTRYDRVVFILQARASIQTFHQVANNNVSNVNTSSHVYNDK